MLIYKNTNNRNIKLIHLNNMNWLIFIRFIIKYTSGIATAIVINSLMPLVTQRNINVSSKCKKTFNMYAIINILNENTKALMNMSKSLFTIKRPKSIVIHKEIIV